MPTFADTDQEEALFRAVEPHRHDKAYTLSIVVPNGGQRSAWLEIARDGDFMLMGFSGGAMGPVTASGARDLSGVSTSFPPAGVAATSGYAERGLQMRISEAEGKTRSMERPNLSIRSTAPWLKQWIPLENILSPGYGFGYYFRPQSFRALIPRGHAWRFDFWNTDTAASGYHRADIVLLGRRYT